MTLLIKRGIEANIPSIQSGEMVYALDKRRLYIGSGSGGTGYEIEFNRLTSSGHFVSNPNGLTKTTLQGLGSVAAGNASITYQVAGGSPSAVTQTLNGHYASTQLQSYGGSTWSTSGRILIQANGDHNEGSRPTNIIFSTVPSGSTTLVDRLKINGVGVFVSGNLGLTGSLVFQDGSTLSSATITTALTASYITGSSLYFSNGNVYAVNSFTSPQITSSYSNLGVVTASALYSAGNFSFGAASTDVHTFTGTSIFTGSITTNYPITSSVTTGTSPLLINSTTLVTNLNADLVDGYQTSVASSANTIVVRDANSAITASTLLGTASYSTTSATASFFGGTVTSASYAVTASFAMNGGGAATFASYSYSALVNISGSSAISKGTVYCTDCLTPQGSGSVVSWDNTSGKWLLSGRVGTGIEVTTSKDVFFTNAVKSGWSFPEYWTGMYLWSDIFRDNKIYMTSGMDVWGASNFSNGGVQHYPSYATGTTRRGANSIGQYLFNNASAFSKAMGTVRTKVGGYGILQVNMCAMYGWSAGNPWAVFIGWSNTSNGSGVVDTTMIGWMFDPSNISGLGATVGGSTTAWNRLVRNAGTLVTSMSTDSGQTVPASNFTSPRFLTVEIVDANTINFWSSTTDESVGTKTQITSTGINTNGNLSPVVALWKGTTTTAEVYTYFTYAKAMVDY